MVAATLFDSVQSDRNNLVIEIGCPSLLINSSDTAWVYVAVITAADKRDVNVGRKLDWDHVQSHLYSLVDL